MPAFILTVSFLLHIILFIAIYYLFQKVQSLKQVRTKEVTDLFEQYLQEIKKENQRLEAKIAKEVTPDHSQLATTPTAESLQHKKNNENEYLAHADLVNDHYEASLESKILQLHHQGLSIEEIARKLDCGKTEAALVIKFSDQKKT